MLYTGPMKYTDEFITAKAEIERKIAERRAALYGTPIEPPTITAEELDATLWEIEQTVHELRCLFDAGDVEWMELAGYRLPREVQSLMSLLDSLDLVREYAT